ncbi:uncharacterized protein LOC127714665 [Mytilus californianus]|uniref:uncharacterized protein LOC127714665 n=1 Tax=Mytilus californianus TaxID=6549 RepID=UPI0022471D5D|nr:uncharacterized protein LOC127714665 [Mytilus californianus]
MISDPFLILFREYKSLEPFPSPLPVGCDIPTGCPLTTSGTPCTSTPSISLEGFCSELLGIFEEECSESSESSSSSSSSEESGGGGRRALIRHIKGKKQKGKKQKGKKQKGKSHYKEKCNEYEELKDFIKDTCANVALTR